MATYYTSSGSLVEVTQVFKRGKNGLGHIVKDRCDRCGGEGGSSHWAMTGYTCFKCNGRRFLETLRPIYTEEQFLALNKRRDTLMAKKQRLAAERAEKTAQEAAERQEEFIAVCGPLLDRAAPLAASNEFIADILAKAKTYAKLSENQIKALEAACEREEKKLAEQQTRGFIGSEGDKGVEITAAVVHHYAQAGFGYNTSVSVWTLKTANGSIVRYKGNSLDFRMKVGDIVTVVSTIKSHYTRPSDGCPITYIIRPKLMGVIEREPDAD